MERKYSNNNDKSISFRANGSIQKFDGFLKLYQETKEDDEKKDDHEDDENILPDVKNGDELNDNGKTTNIGAIKKKKTKAQ